MKQLDRFFHLSQRGTTVRREILGGCTTFCSMAYLVLVIPDLLSGTGLDFGEVMTATCLVAGIGSIALGLASNLPWCWSPASCFWPWSSAPCGNG